MSEAYTILTNNRLVSTGFDKDFEVMSMVGGLDIFYETLSNRLQNGYRLVSSPLPANVPLIRSPVRTVILQKNHQRYDSKGIILVEKAKERFEALGFTSTLDMLDDLEMIDRDQLKRAVCQLRELV